MADMTSSATRGSVTPAGTVDLTPNLATWATQAGRSSDHGEVVR